MVKILISCWVLNSYNYILHGEISERQLYDSQLRTVSDVLEALKASDLNVNEETDALFESLSQLPLKYAKAMTKITTLREKGASLHRLIFKGRVKQDKTYIQALNQLNQLVSSKFTEEQAYSQRYLDQLVKSSQENFMMALVTIFICILLAIFVFAIQMPRLLAKSVHAVRHMTDKDALEIQELANRNDEFGALAKGIEYSANKMIEEEVMRQQQSVKEKICVEEEQKKARANHLEKLANDFEKSLGVIISDVSSYVEQAHQQAKLVNTMSNQLMEKSGHANDSSQEGIIFVELTERLSEEIRKSALGISEECKGASHLAVETRADTQKINQMISRLTEVSDRIDSVVRNISGIARNTRLLSMNATIEGASAGEAGKGFAVVANEVKGLASESAAAVEHIREEIGFMKQEIEATAKVLGETVENIGAVHQSVQTVSDSVNSQVQDIESVASNAGQASQSMQSIVKVIHHLSGAAEESEGASTELYGLINQVDEKMKEAKGNMQFFLQAIR